MAGETKFRELIRTLSQAEVEFIVIGGVAAAGHGSARLTLDLDVVYRRTAANIARLVSAIKPIRPYLRGAPPGLPFSWDQEAVKKGLNFTLITDLGALDLLGAVTGGGTYDELLPHSIKLRLHETDCFCLDLDYLIKVKRAAGRPKDFEAIAELEAIREEISRQR